MENPNKSYSKELQESFDMDNLMPNPLSHQLLLYVQEDFKGENEEIESFTYLLLDPRITRNLRARSREVPQEPPVVLWASFIDSIYYVGKGRASRGYQHFKSALKEFREGKTESNNPKIQRILDIWSENYGVLLIHVFEDMSSNEANTYEAAIIDVIGLSNLTNVISGTYYGNAKNFTQVEKNMLGLNLLWKAFNINMYEGERQMRPENI